MKCTVAVVVNERQDVVDYCVLGTNRSTKIPFPRAIHDIGRRLLYPWVHRGAGEKLGRCQHRLV